MTKRTIAIAGALLLAALPLFAQGQGQAQPQGRGGHPGPGGPGWMPMLHQLNLTDAQKEQIKALSDAERQAGPPKTFELEQKLHAAVLADQPNLQTIESLKEARADPHARAEAAAADASGAVRPRKTRTSVSRARNSDLW
jgi:Spy/CpxP family protein refolding chaperone